MQKNTQISTYSFVNGDEQISEMKVMILTVDIIAPTPVQNETIAVEIVDIEKVK